MTELPEQFVWSRFGTEAGEKIDAILLRKERERAQADGVFLWGIGNSIAPAIRHMLATATRKGPVVVFSPMKAKPRGADVAPGRVALWREAVGLDGHSWVMPSSARVTSRMDTNSKAKLHHYALVCHSSTKLTIDGCGPRFSIAELRNLLSGNPVGHSQVTSVVRYVGNGADGEYVAAFIASLTYPFFVRLSDPCLLSGPSTGRATQTRAAAAHPT